MRFTMPHGPPNLTGDRRVKCLEVNDAYLDCAHGKYHEGNDVVAYHGHGGVNQNFDLGFDFRLRVHPAMKMMLKGDQHGCKLADAATKPDVYYFKNYGRKPGVDKMWQPHELKGMLYELESHPGHGLRLEKGGETIHHTWYKLIRVHITKAMRFTAPAGDYNGM